MLMFSSDAYFLQKSSFEYSFTSLFFRSFGDRKNSIVESINEATCFIFYAAITIHSDESKWFDGLNGHLIYFLVTAGMIIGAVINIEMVIG